MQIIILILTALAAVLAGAALILVIQERRYNREFANAVDQRFKTVASANKDSKKALLKYVDESDKQVRSFAEKLQKESSEKILKDTNARIEKISGVIRAVNMKADSAKKQAKENAAHIKDLEQGVVPDYEVARKAVDEVNKFNEGIAGILGFDPLAAMKKSRQEDD